MSRIRKNHSEKMQNKIEEKYVDVATNRVHYLESGNSKRTVVLIHGLGASAERWKSVIPRLGRKYRVIAPDLLGFGHSDKPLVEYTPEFFAEFLFNFLKTVDVKMPFIIGSSLGGRIAVEYALRYGQYIEKIILVSPAGSIKHPTPALVSYIKAALYPSYEGVKTAFELMANKGEKISQNIINDFIERMQIPNAKMAFMSTLQSLEEDKTNTVRFAQIFNPTLIIWGENDSVIPINYAVDFTSTIKNCKYHVIKNGGHVPYVENPEEFTKIVLNFFDNNRLIPSIIGKILKMKKIHFNF